MRRRKLLFAVLILGCGHIDHALAQRRSGDKSSGHNNTIIESDPSTFVKLVDKGRGKEAMYDRREGKKTTLNAHLFTAYFDDGLEFLVRVNPEFGDQAEAKKVAEKYSRVIGKLPTALRSNVHELTIHRGDHAQSGGSGFMLIHTDRAEKLEAKGRLEEILAHEAAHASIAPGHKTAKGWVAAQKADGKFWSKYAENNPVREDIPVSFVAYMGIRYRSDRLSKERIEKIKETIPNRIAYFDSLDLDMYPITPRKPSSKGNPKP